MISKFFINRPIFATVLSLFILLAGVACILNLPIAQYPELTPPTIEVNTTYLGASAEVIADTVAAPLEQEINGVDDMIYMQSNSSSDGSMSLNISFNIGTDPDKALINVNNRVQQASALLPQTVRQYGVKVEKKSTSMLEIISLTSPNNTYDATYMGNYALVNIVDDLKRLPGVGVAKVMSANDYSMRIWLKPDVLAKLHLSTDEVIAAIAEQNAQRAAGKVGQPPLPVKIDRVYSIQVEGRLKTEEEFGDIILRANADGTTLRLKDVADIELGSQTYEFISNLNGKDAVPIGIYLSPGANAVQTAKYVENKMAELSKNFPPDMVYNVPYDTTKFVEVSIEEVIHTLVEALILVFLVVFLFLKDWRATLIPCLAVPVSIVGAFAGMKLLNFSINTLTLFGLVLAIGIVVDDAIIVIENVERLMEEKGLQVKQATIEAMQEVSGPLVAIVLVLCAVFVPVSFMGGMTGAMYKQFAITIAVSVAISGFVALTLTPALTVLIFKKPEHKTTGFFAWFDRQFEKLTNKYTAISTFFVTRRKVSLLCYAIMLVLILVLFKFTPSSMLPSEDQGIMMTAVQLDDGTPLSKTAETVKKIEKFIMKQPAVKESLSFVGFDLLSSGMRSNAGAFFITLKDWKERETQDLSINTLIYNIYKYGMADIPNALVMPFNMPPIMGMSTTGGIEGFIQTRSSSASSKDLAASMSDFIQEAQKSPAVESVSTTFSANVPQLKLLVDNTRVKSLNVSMDALFSTLGATFGTYYVNDFTKYGRSFKVMVQARGDYRAHKEQINGIYVSSNSGDMIPLSSLIRFEEVKGADSISRFNLFKAANFIATPAAGYSSGQAMTALENAAKKALGQDYSLAWTGSAYQEKLTGSASVIALMLGILVVFLILSAQYEKWSLPTAVLLAIPFAIFGAIFGVFLRGLHFLPANLAQIVSYLVPSVFINTLNNDIYFQIALVTLVGLAAKNAILIVEFAVMLHNQGKTHLEAAITAAKLRFRPIVMTSLAFILGTVPLAISSGAGSASRHSIGTAVVAGMLGATLLEPIFVPLFYVLVSGKDKKENKDEENKNVQ